MRLDDLPDGLLLARYAQGDPAAARLLVARFAPRVLAHAARLLDDPQEAEDMAQEALIKLWRIAPHWREEAQVSTWLYRVVGNLALDRLRARKRRGGVGLDQAQDLPDEQPEIWQRMMAQDRQKALHLALTGLPDRQKQAIVLRHLEGLPNGEIAQIMELTVDAVESLIARGRRALAARLSGQKAEMGFKE